MFRGEGELVFEGFGAAFVVGDIIAFLVLEGFTGGEELFVGGAAVIADGPEDAIL